MEQTVLKIAVAGLMHDIGKFAQGSMQISRQYANDNADQYQPFYNNHHSHIHALYTAAFIEQFSDKLPPCFNEAGWGDGDSFINLAAGHHKPETPMQWIVTMADRISSGLDRATFEEGEKIAFQDFKKTRLLPLFEGLGAGEKDGYEKLSDFNYRYPLAPLAAGSVFPLYRDAKSLQGDANREYQALFDTFVRQLGKLQHREDGLELWVNHFDSLLQTCTALIPAARVGDVIPDVSLYDHALTTAAFASALYQYHLQMDNLDERSIRNSSEEKLLLVTGDFYGIQDFIFSAGGEMKKFRSKLLRGRSFAVSLFSELAADLLCRELGLSTLSVILNAAGKFTLLAANTKQSRDTVLQVETTINNWLFEISCGQASMGIAVTPASTSQFYCNAYGKLHDTHMRDVQKRKKQKLDMERYSGTMDGYLESFDGALASPLCGLCGKRPADARSSADRSVLGETGISVCPVCRDHVMLGSGVVKHNRLAVLDSADSSTSGKELHRPLFGRYQLRFMGSGGVIADAEVLKMWQVNTNADGSLFSDVTMRPLNGYVPLYRPEDEHDDCLLAGRREEDKTLELIDQINIGDPKTFSHIALKARRKNSDGKCVSGTEAIGVLKADVDNLGLLMGCGLPEKRFTLSRMATLSRQLDAFFSLYLPNLLAGSDDFKDMYTVFAGGDDLFLIGPWNKMAYLAVYLKKRFAEYVCANKRVTFSAGITIHKAHVPVDKLARSAEDALEESKNAEGGKKNSVTMFGQTVTWENFQALLENRNGMQSWLDRKYISSAMMYRFNHLIALAEQERAALAGGDVYLDDLAAMKWRSMFSYSIQRNINSSLKGDERQSAVQDVSLMAGWMDTYGAAVRIPLWHLLYDKR
jgi:CRISPR-associated protein Csm1